MTTPENNQTDTSADLDADGLPKDDLQLPSELDVLKQRALVLGVEFSNNIGLETLRQRVAAKQAEIDADTPSTNAGEATPTVTDQPNPLEGYAPGEAPVKPVSLRKHLHDTEMRLVRVRITNMDPKKKDLPGEIFTFANEYLGTVRKFVPFGEQTDNGYHVPYCIFKMMESRLFLDIKTKTHPVTKQISVLQRWSREFALEILPELTEAEIDRLAREQAASGRLNDE